MEAIGARPVLVDVARDSWCLDAEALEEVSGDKIEAVIVSHLHGGLADMAHVVAIARQRGWQVVEDACQQPGAKLDGRTVGAWGEVSVLSFGGSKLLTAGRGGAVLTDDATIQQRIKVFSEQGNQAFPLRELQAAVLRPQLAQLDERNAVRQERIAILREATRELSPDFSPWLRPVACRANYQPAYFKHAWSFVPAESEPELREQLLTILQTAGAPIDAGFRGFVGRGKRRCEQPVPLTSSAMLSQSTVLLHHPMLLAHEKAAQQVAEVLNYAVQQMAR